MLSFLSEIASAFAAIAGVEAVPAPWIPDKIAAVKELTKMCGWAQPDRIELAATDTLADFINSICQSGRLAHMRLANLEDNGR